MPGKLFIISAPSGAGKTTLVKHLVERLGTTHNLSRVVTYTTKPPRSQEQDKQDYCFISVAEFEQKIAQGYFLEWSNAYGHYYGSPCTLLEKLTQGGSLLLIVDRTGARQIKEKLDDVVLIWLHTTSIQVLKERLAERGSETEQQMRQRIELAKAEMLQEQKEQLYDFCVLNDDFFEAIKKLESIVMRFCQY